MENTRKCPICSAVLQTLEDQCPVCGLTGLNQIFVSKEDRDAWLRQVVEPYAAFLTPLLSAGMDHILILKRDGRLYGLGKDDTGQIGGGGSILNYRARKLAEGVKYAAAGRNYSVLINGNKEVQILGRGEYAEFFSGFGTGEEPGAWRVYAEKDMDVFWIQDEKGGFWGFGDNESAMITPIESTPIHQFPTETYQYCYYKEYKTISNAGSSSEYWQDVNDAFVRGREISHRLVETAEYQTLIDRYGSSNLKLVIGHENPRLIGSDYQGASFHFRRLHEFFDYNRLNSFKEYEVTTDPVVYLVNHHIYRPVPCGEENIFGSEEKDKGEKCQVFSMGAASFEYTIRNPYNSNTYRFYLDKDTGLFREIRNYAGEVIRQDLLVEHVSGVSMSQHLYVLSLHSGETMAGAFGDLIESKPSNIAMNPVIFDD